MAQLNIAPVETYYHQLATVLNQGLERTIRMEAAATVRRAMQLQPTRPVSTEKIRETSRRKFAGKFYDGGGVGGSINSSMRKGVLGQAWLVRMDIGKALPLYPTGWDGRGKIPAPIDHQGQGNRVTDAQWSKWRNALTRGVKAAERLAVERIGARGLTQKSWFELLLKIAKGDPVNAPAAIMRARPVKGGSRTVAAAIGNKTPSAFALTIVNDSGLAVATGGQRKLNSAISIRRAFFMRSLEQGFYTDAKFVARNYRWASVSKT